MQKIVALDRSKKQAVGRLDQLTSKLSDEQLQAQVSPGRNRVYYVIGQLTVVHDRLFPLLNLGERLHPELDEQFVSNPDRKVADTVSRQIYVRLSTK
jgi:hypothetical protein